MNQPVADMIKPGMKWTDMLRDSARAAALRRRDRPRGRVARTIAVQNRTNFQSRYEADLGNGKWHSISMHPTDLGGFVVTRADISERKKAEAAEREATALLQQVLDACPSPTRMSTIDGRDALPQSGQQGALWRPPRTASTTTSTRATATR